MDRYSVVKLPTNNVAVKLKPVLTCDWVVMFAALNFLLVGSSAAASAPGHGEFAEHPGVSIKAAPVRAHSSEGVLEQRHKTI